MRTYRKTRVEKLCAENPQLELFIKSEMKLGRSMDELSKSIAQRFGCSVPRQTLQSYYSRVFRPEANAEMLAYRRARSEAAAWLQEIRSGADIDAAKIAEIALARQIVASTSKLADADVLAMMFEQRKRQELELKREQLEQERAKLKVAVEKLEREKKAVAEEITERAEKDPADAVRRIRELYGLAASGGSATAAIPAGMGER